MTQLPITIETVIHAPIENIWAAWTTPEDICLWNAASDDWHTTRATLDLRPGGAFLSRMEAKDGSMGFDFTGTFTEVETGKRIAYVMTDGRRAETDFTPHGDHVHIRTRFDPETMHPVEFQQAGWQAILDNFARYVTSHKTSA